MQKDPRDAVQLNDIMMKQKIFFLFSMRDKKMSYVEFCSSPTQTLISVSLLGSEYINRMYMGPSESVHRLLLATLVGQIR